MSQLYYNDTPLSQMPASYPASRVMMENGTSAQDSIEKSAMTELSGTEPYVLRQGKGDLVDLSLVGGSVGWNQLVQNGNFASTDNWTASNGTLAVSNNVATITSTATNNQGIYQNFASISGHKYLFSANVKVNTSNTDPLMRFVISNGGLGDERSYILTANTRSNMSRILSATDNWTKLYLIGAYSGSNISVNDTIEISNFNTFDLTLLLGSTIADYIYSLEQTTEGAGVAFFRNYFPNVYYTYDAGSIQSVCTSGRKVVGKNLFDEVYPNLDSQIRYKHIYLGNGTFTMSTTAAASSGACALFLLSGAVTSGVNNETNGVYVNRPIATQSLDGYVTVAYRIHDGINPLDASTQIEFGSTATSYEPYTSTTSSISPIQLRGIPKLIDNKLNYDGDVYRADGSITRKYGIVDLGSLTWTYNSTNIRFISDGIQSLIKAPTGIRTTPMVCSALTVYFNGESIDSSTDKVIYTSVGGSLYAHWLSTTDPATFKTAMSGVYLVYELATPTTESASAYQNPQRSYPDGTEEFINGASRDVMVPVGNVSKYTSNEVIPVVEDYVDGKFTHESVSVTADGTKTYSQLLDALYALLDTTKLTPFSVLQINKDVYQTITIDTTTLIFTACIFNTSTGRVCSAMAKVASSSSTLHMQTSEGNFDNYSSSVPANGRVITLYY